MSNKIRIMQIRSSIGILPKHKLTLIGLGLKRIGHVVERKNSNSLKGMINKISYLVKILE